MSRFKFNNYVRDWYGEKDYTIEEGIKMGKGKVKVEKSIYTNFKPEYSYVEGILAMRLDGREAKKYLKGE